MSPRAEALLGIAVVLFALVPVALLVAPSESAEPRSALRVCADPDNLPYSDAAGNGFENRLAELIAGELNLELEYEWLPQGHGPAADTMGAGCDVVMGVPAGYANAPGTVPYYRSTWVFVYRADRGLEISSLDDPALRELRIGVPGAENDDASAPAAGALGRRGIIENVVGYGIPGDSIRPQTPARLIEAVAGGEIDVAIAWGPAAGYFASLQDVELNVVPVSPRIDPPLVPLELDISMAVRQDDDALRAGLERVIRTRAADIRKILDEFGVPTVNPRGNGVR